jgi:uncharacterized protein (TIGR03435 family)
MAMLARTLSGVVGRIVEDRTGLEDAYDFNLEFTPEGTPLPGGGAPAAAPDPNSPSVFTALEEQLGVKLQPERAPVDVLVIDRVERPTPN